MPGREKLVGGEEKRGSQKPGVPSQRDTGGNRKIKYRERKVRGIKP